MTTRNSKRAQDMAGWNSIASYTRGDVRLDIGDEAYVLVEINGELAPCWGRIGRIWYVSSEHFVRLEVLLPMDSEFTLLSSARVNAVRSEPSEVVRISWHKEVASGRWDRKEVSKEGKRTPRR